MICFFRLDWKKFDVHSIRNGNSRRLQGIYYIACLIYVDYFMLDTLNYWIKNTGLRNTICSFLERFETENSTPSVESVLKIAKPH